MSSTPRRRFLKSLSSIAATALLPSLSPTAQAAIVGTNSRWGATSDPALWQRAWAKRFTNVLPNPLAAAGIYKPSAGASEYTISVHQGTADILGLGIQTTIWGYHNQETGPTFPGRTLQVQKGTAIKVHWVNGLSNAAGSPLPHILPIDQTITIQTDAKGQPISGVPLAVHHHGGDTAQEFDGGPDQWATPQRKQTGPGINNAAQLSTPGAITYQYDNQQEASMHWYHDHAESITGVNVWAGLAGLYAVRDANEKALQTRWQLPGAQHEVALVLQDRLFDAQGQFTYAANPVDSPTPVPAEFPAGNPSHMPEMFGDVLLVNGKAWPKLQVTPRPWRFRLLNGSDSRFYQLKLSSAAIPMYVVGTDLGFLNKPVKIGSQGLTIAPGERYDVVIDFTAALWAGNVIDLLNSAPTPFPGGGAPTAGTANVMRFNVGFSLADLFVPRAWTTTATVLRGSNGTAALPTTPAVPANATVRRILLGEGADEYGRITPMLGTYDPTGARNLGTLSFQDPATETPRLGTTEVWEFWNATVDAHPVHLHLVQFRLHNRQAFTGTVADKAMTNGWTGVTLQPGATLGAVSAPASHETGWKDTVICPPGQVTRVVVSFNRPGKYVYHCHLLSHEDHDMMRWYTVV